MADCVFCGIIKKTVPSEIVYEDDQVVAFPDIKPQASVHYLVVPKEHIDSIDQATPQQAELVGQLLEAAAKIGKSHTSGTYHLTVNAGDHVEVNHLHVHVLGERRGGDAA